MSGRGGAAQLGLRWKAVGLMTSGLTSRQVASRLGVHQSSVSRWFKKDKRGESLEDKKRSGRPSIHNKISKMVLSKSLTKRRQSTRKLAKRLSAKGHQMSHMTVHRYLVKNLGAKAMKRPKIPKLTPQHKNKRLEFCLERRDWTVNDWKKVIFSDESPYLLFPEGNSKNDIVWAKNTSDVEPSETVKFSPKIMVWGAISASSLSELHIVPQKTSVTADYYTENILAEILLSMFTQNRTTGSLVGRRLVDVKSEMIFMQDGARAHTAAATYNGSGRMKLSSGARRCGPRTPLT